MASKVTLYTTAYCPYCVGAKQLLDGKGVSYDEIKVDHDAALRQEMMERSGRRTVPQIWVGGTHVGGFDDLAALEKRGELDSLLAQAAP